MLCAEKEQKKRWKGTRQQKKKEKKKIEYLSRIYYIYNAQAIEVKPVEFVVHNFNAILKLI